MALEIQDIYAAGSLATIRARCDEPSARLEARIRRRDDDSARDNHEVYAAKLAREADSSYVADIPGLTEGTYRITVAGGAKVGSATDVFLVARP